MILIFFNTKDGPENGGFQDRLLYLCDFKSDGII